MKEEFHSSVSRGGSILTPDTIVTTEDSVTWKKRNSYLIGSNSKTIPIDSTASIDVKNKMWGTDITITAFGDDSIVAENFTGADAKKIKELLEKLRNV